MKENSWNVINSKSLNISCGSLKCQCNKLWVSTISSMSLSIISWISLNTISSMSLNITSCVSMDFIRCESLSIISCISLNIISCISLNNIRCISHNIISCISLNIIRFVSMKSNTLCQQLNVIRIWILNVIGEFHEQCKVQFPQHWGIDLLSTNNSTAAGQSVTGFKEVPGVS